MRLLVVNHPRLGAMPGGIPEHVIADRSVHATRAAWFRAVERAVQERVHVLFLTGEIIAPTNTSLEPFGPLTDGIAQLEQADIPVVVVSDGVFTPAMARRFNLERAVQFLEDLLDWDPVVTTSRDVTDGAAIHVIAANLAESTDAPVNNPITLAELDHPGLIWLLTDSLQPDMLNTDHALVLEPGSLTPLSAEESDGHGAWLVHTDTAEASLVPLASLEFAAIEIDVHSARNVEDVERIIAQALIAAADRSEDDSIATTLIVHATLTGSTRMYAGLVDIADELQRTLTLEHEGVHIAMSGIDIDATPEINLEPLVGRPDPVGEIARLLQALASGEEPGEAQTKLMTAVEQKLLAVTHARVFGSIVDTPLATDANTALQRQAWAALDTMVRQRGID